MHQETFDEYMERNPKFNGSDYNDARDGDRLKGQLLRVYQFMRGGGWHSLKDIADGTGDPEASISAQLRNLRKPRFGGHTIEKTYQGNGLYIYRMIEPKRV